VIACKKTRMQKILQSIEDIKISKLLNNSGQLLESHGIPENPRRITKVQFHKLLASINDSNLAEIKPLQVIPYDNKYIVLAGNQRLRAYRQLKYKTVKCFVLRDDLDWKIYQKVIITDNTHYGSNDDDLLANMFEAEDLLDWGVELPELSKDDVDSLLPERNQIKDDFKIVVSEQDHEKLMALMSELQDRGYKVKLK
jgi:ParB-like chromosome segregation protein Spo0J